MLTGFENLEFEPFNNWMKSAMLGFNLDVL